jgi:hypothetical protein
MLNSSKAFLLSALQSHSVGANEAIQIRSPCMYPINYRGHTTLLLSLSFIFSPYHTNNDVRNDWGLLATASFDLLITGDY